MLDGLDNPVRVLRKKYYEYQLTSKIPELPKDSFKYIFPQAVAHLVFDVLKAAYKKNLLKEIAEQHLNINKDDRILCLIYSEEFGSSYEYFFQWLNEGLLVPQDARGISLHHHIAYSRLDPYDLSNYLEAGLELNRPSVQSATPLHYLALNHRTPEIPLKDCFTYLKSLTNEQGKPKYDFTKKAYFHKVNEVVCKREFSVIDLIEMNYKLSADSKAQIRAVLTGSAAVALQQAFMPKPHTQRELEFAAFRGNNHNASLPAINEAAFESLNRLLQSYGRKFANGKNILQDLRLHIRNSNMIGYASGSKALEALEYLEKYDKKFINTKLNIKEILALVWHASSDKNSGLEGIELMDKDILWRQNNIIQELANSQNADQHNEHSCDKGLVNRIFLSLSGLHKDIWIIADKADLFTDYIYEKVQAKFHSRSTIIREEILNGWSSDNNKEKAEFIRELKIELKKELTEKFGRLFKETDIDHYILGLDDLNIQVLLETDPKEKIENPKVSQLQKTKVETEL